MTPADIRAGRTYPRFIVESETIHGDWEPMAQDWRIERAQELRTALAALGFKTRIVRVGKREVVTDERERWEPAVRNVLMNFQGDLNGLTRHQLVFMAETARHVLSRAADAIEREAGE